MKPEHNECRDFMSFSDECVAKVSDVTRQPIIITIIITALITTFTTISSRHSTGIMPRHMLVLLGLGWQWLTSLLASQLHT